MGRIICPIHGDQIMGLISLELRKAILAQQSNHEKVIVLSLIDIDEPADNLRVLAFEYERETLRQRGLVANQLTLGEINESFMPVCGQCARDYLSKNGLTPGEGELRVKIVD